MSITMSGLRIFVDSQSPSETSPPGIEVAETMSNRVFYSRRGNGPIYRWLYEESRAHWRALRVNTSEFAPQRCSNVSWKTVPETLQAQLGAHYLD